MNFTKGNFVKLRANSVIHLGRLERNIYEGDVVEYDGFSLKFGGLTTEMPELKAGVKRGWLSILSSEKETLPEPTQAIEPASKKEMPVQNVYDEERAVAEVTPTEKVATTKFPVVVESQDDDIVTVATVDNNSGAEISGASSASDGIAEMQEAESISTIKLSTASKQKTVISDGSQASAEITKLDNMTVKVTPTKTASVQVEDDLEIGDTQKTSEAEDQALENTQILQAIDGDVQPSQGAVVVGKDESKIKVLPGGIEWDTSKHWSKRAKIALDMYGNQPEILNEIIKVESKGVVSAIEKGRSED